MVEYIVKEVQNPQNRKESKYHAQPVHKNKVTQEKLEEKIVRKTSLSRADVRAASIALVDEITDAILNGESIKIDGLGTFSLRYQSEGKENAKQVSGRDFHNMSIGFRAIPELKRKINIELKFKKKPKR